MHRVIRWLPAVVLPLVLVGSAAAIILIGGPNNPLARRMSSVFNFTTGSGYGRIRILRLVLGDLSDPILGMGDGSFNIALPAGLNQTPDGHPWIYSMFLAVLHDSGIIGLALWFIFLGVIYVQLIRVIRSDLWPGLQTYAIAVGVVLTSLLVSAQATTSMYLIFFWAFLGLAGAVPGLAARDRARLAAREEATDAIDGADAGRQEAEMDVALLDRGGIRRTEPSQSDIHP